MPIRPENKGRYPKDWKRIREAILERAKHSCERCGLPNYAVGYRDNQGRFRGVQGSILHDMAGIGLSHPSLERITCKESREMVEKLNCCTEGKRPCDNDGHHFFFIVLTIAHLDHIPENCNPSNLQALCQRCHNRLDARHRAQGRKQRREAIAS